jgi:hypothetical protein
MVRMSPAAPCAYILHPELAAALRRPRSVSSDIVGQMSGTERLIGGGKDCQSRLGRTNKKPHNPLRAVRFKS